MTDLAPFSLGGRFWRGNLHTHSTLSDGALPPDRVVEAYKDAGYDFMMLSDHFLDRYDWPIADTRGMRSNRFTTIIGAELHAPETTVGELWHIVAAGLPLDFAPCGPDENGPALAGRAAATGAFVGIAHPAWSQLTMEDARALKSAHAVEIYNHGCAVETDRGEGWYLYDQMVNEGARISAFATDDAHFKVNDFFGGWVHVKAESLEPEALVEALKQGHYYASQGPEIHALSLEGNALTVVSSPVDVVAVVCGNSRAVTRHGRAVTHTVVDVTKLEEGWLLRNKSPWFRVVLIDGAGKRAWTSAFWWKDLQ